MLESVLTVRWLDGDRVETAWRSRGDPGSRDHKFHSSNKQCIEQVHWQRLQIRQIWTSVDQQSHAYRSSDHQDLSDRRARHEADYRRACRRDRVRRLEVQARSRRAGLSMAT